MNSLDIKANLRTDLGKPGSKQLRREEKVPSVLYGLEAPLHVSVAINDFKKLVYTPDSYLVNLDVEGKVHQAILQDTQFHPVSDKLIHADFLAVSADKTVTVEIPVATTGTSVGVAAGGRLASTLRSIKVKGLVSVLPDVIEIDIAKLKIGDSVKVQNLNLPEGVAAVNAASAVVVAVKTTRAAASTDAGGAIGEGEEGAEAATEEKAEA
jgi:large subunit ribosomal protein L25